VIPAVPSSVTTWPLDSDSKLTQSLTLEIRAEPTMEVDASADVLQNIREYAKNARKRLEDAMDIDEQSSSAAEARLSSVISDLQKRLDQRQAELNRVCIDSL
jgi:hypothetical protein